MNDDVLALKYRPKKFDEVVGQDFIVKTLSNSISLEKIHNAYLFSGTRGVGKTTIGRIFAKSLLCEKGVSINPCGTCTSCTQIDSGNHLDLIEIDAASRTKVEDTRILMENVQYSPTSSQFKVYLIDEVHMLSNKSFNALLKTIEEPPKHVKFLLATTEPEKLPETVLSRCLHFKLSTVDNDTINTHLLDVLVKEDIKFEKDVVKIISRAAQGSIRDALSLLEQCIAYCNGELDEKKIKSLLGEIDTEIIQNLIINIFSYNPEKLIEAIEKLSPNSNYEKIIDHVISIFYKITLFKIKPSFLDKNSSDLKFIEDQSKSIDSKDLQLFYQIAISSKKDFKFSVNKRDHLTMILLRMIFFNNENVSNKSEDNNQNVHKHDSSTEKEAVNDDSAKDTKQATNGADSMSDDFNEGTSNSFVWDDLYKKLNISGLSLDLAKNSIYIPNGNGQAILKISQNKKDVYPKTCINDLINQINHFFDKKISIEIEYEENLISPSVKEEKKEQDEVDEAFNSADTDKNINNIKEHFDAEIDKNSIKKIKGR